MMLPNPAEEDLNAFIDCRLGPTVQQSNDELQTSENLLICYYLLFA
jgi:hypothetical protein